MQANGVAFLDEKYSMLITAGAIIFCLLHGGGAARRQCISALTSGWLGSGVVVLAVLSTSEFLTLEPKIQLAAAVAVLASRLGFLSSGTKAVHACQSTA